MIPLLRGIDYYLCMLEIGSAQVERVSGRIETERFVYLQVIETVS